MILKRICCLIFALFVLHTNGYAQTKENGVSEDFKINLTEKQIKDISIMIPNYLKEKHSSKGVYTDTATGNSIILLITEESLPDGLKGAFSSQHEFWEKTFYPENNPVFNVWNELHKSQYDKIERMEKVDFGNFHGFITKGFKEMHKRYVYDYTLFKKGDKERIITIIIASRDNYFLTDKQSNYIASTVKVAKDK